MYPITVVGLGPGDPCLLTQETQERLFSGQPLVLRTAVHPVADLLREKGILFQSLDDLYESSDDFDALTSGVVNAVAAAARTSPVHYAVMDPLSDETVMALRKAYPASVRVCPSPSRRDTALASLPDSFVPDTSARMLTASRAAGMPPDPDLPLLVTELTTRETAGLVKLQLLDLYPEEMPVAFGRVRQMRSIPLYTLDRQKTYDHLTVLYVPASPLSARTRYRYEDLLAIMERLRGEGGCSWDRKQTHQSLRPYLLEEAYEAAGAIDEDDDLHLCEELGDVLLQIVFHASIARSHGSFSDTDVSTAISAKMIHRHPNVFAGAEEDASVTWDTLKKEEQGIHSQSEMLAAVSRALPALTRAEKVQKRDARVGFTWSSALDALRKVREETEEVQSELEAGRDPMAELGDLLFACVSVIRLSQKDPEETLTRATEKFIRRFSAMERQILSDGKTFDALTLSEMDVYWTGAKTAEP